MIVINSTILWTLIGGLLGKYFFIRVLPGFFVLYVTEYTRKRNSSDTKAHEEDENVNIVNTVLRSPEKLDLFEIPEYFAQHITHNAKCASNTMCGNAHAGNTMHTLQNAHVAQHIVHNAKSIPVIESSIVTLLIE